MPQGGGGVHGCMAGTECGPSGGKSEEMSGEERRREEKRGEERRREERSGEGRRGAEKRTEPAMFVVSFFCAYFVLHLQ